MLSKLKEKLKELEKNQKFKEFKKKNSEAYLASCVIITDGKNTGDWQASYYQPKKHKITTFALKNPIELKGEDEVFQKHKTKVEELKLSKVKINFDKMKELIEKLRKEKYPGEYPNKIIAVLQKSDDKIVWNITHLTSTLKIWNIKLDAEKGEIIEDKIENVFSLKAS